MSESESAAGPAPSWVPLKPRERRVVGVMVEKAKTTPEYYPMTVAAIVAACNQKSNRDPVTNYDQDDVEETLHGLRKKGVVILLEGSGRVARWKHTLYEWLKVSKVELAVLAELLLRGPQTEGELRQRASRMEPIDDLDALRSALRPLAERRLMLFLGEEGRRGTLITHGFHAPKEIDLLKSQSRVEEASAAAPVVSTSWASAEELREAKAEIAALRAQMQQVQETLQYTKQQLQTLKQSLGEPGA
jgi:uncharacterized protein YceH (UPF0502 family)